MNIYSFQIQAGVGYAYRALVQDTTPHHGLKIGCRTVWYGPWREKTGSSYLEPKRQAIFDGRTKANELNM
jgi:hypothetical protein